LRIVCYSFSLLVVSGSFFSPGLDIGMEISSWGRRDDKGLRIEGLIPAQTSIAPNETDFLWKEGPLL
jgi:hypothetical protein